ARSRAQRRPGVRGVPPPCRRPRRGRSSRGAGRHGRRRALRHRADDRPRPDGPHRRRPVGDRHPRDAVRRGAAGRPRPARLGRPRPLHPLQGPLCRRAVRHARLLRLLRARRAHDLHGAAVDAQRPPGPQEGPRRRDQHGSAGAWLPRRGRLRAGREAAALGPSHLRRHGRRRDAGGQQLGGDDDRAALRARQPHRRRRSQPAPAGRAHGGHQAARAVRRQVAQLRLGGPRGRRPRPWRAAGGLRAVGLRITRRGGRQHHEGQGRVVHRGSRRVAPQGADSRAGRGRAGGAGPM
ncbi:MAG: Transketolase, N-terminal section, partial [uncultured Solirubrobacteraceae bacterium]